ncbi:alpha/beta fold hydrolase [Gilvimarinus sp. SDUM040013]|uniref:Alpha/beta fold hydrolase n=1 Tax=Gilvimarinus gilvus TaxID=3058038 RepID=A0ABU4S2N6_9GAMM|nr:alpha/beta fold hydrolase [Gilvimarinus sp. SDUM040013]MDO3386609.1 alpha/beta fold hydrolase [Gilvimarinus sp. SDUM040013]MDX6849504.1 alpha/beta fold hydrolase [Gilvimarinus sp. SDUM040013]
MQEQEVNIQSGEVTLAGTLCIPHAAGKFSAVLMVHGSGPLDRNGNMKGQNLNIFSELAHAFDRHGIASLRYDKRGCGNSSGDFLTAGYSDLVQDAERCLEALAQSKLVSCDHLYILGHSEGCSIASKLSQSCESVSGLVLLCPSIEQVEPLLIRQAEQLEKEIGSLPGMSGYFYRIFFKIMGRPVRMQKSLLRKVRESDLPVVRHGLSRQPAKWLREILQLNTENVFASTHVPILLVAGNKDLQCRPNDIYRIADVAQGPTETVMINGMTHLLRIDERPASLLGSARLLGRPLDGMVSEKAAQWIIATMSANHQLRAASGPNV